MQRAKLSSLLPFLHRLLPSKASQSPFSSLSSTPKTPSQESVLYVLRQLSKNPPKALEFFNHAASLPSFTPGPSAFNLMLRILAGSPDHVATAFWPFLRSMASQGHSIDDGTYLTLLSTFKNLKLTADVSALTDFYSSKGKETDANDPTQRISKILDAPEAWSEKTVKELDGIDLVLSEACVAKLLREMRNDPLKGLAFFRWASRRSPDDYRHGSTAYNAMARVLGREESIKEFWELVEEMKNEGLEVDIDTYVKLSRQFMKSKMVVDSVRLYELMMDGPYKPASQDCGVLLRHISLSGAPDMDLVMRVVSKFQASGHSLSKMVYDGIHRSLTSNGRFEEAEEIMNKMRGAGYEPDNITYSQLVYGLCKAKQFDEACEVLDEMEGKRCIPDLKTWTVLIQGHCFAGQVDKALECLTKMLEKSYEADADLLDILVKGLCGQKRVDGAKTLFIEMSDKARLKPWQATYKYLIQELIKERKLEEALKILSSMKKHNYPPFAEPFPPHISKFGTVEDARELLKALSVKAYPSHTAYLHVFTSFFSEGRFTEAQDLLFKCPHHIRKHADITKLFGSIKAENAS